MMPILPRVCVDRGEGTDGLCPWSADSNEHRADVPELYGAMAGLPDDEWVDWLLANVCLSDPGLDRDHPHGGSVCGFRLWSDLGEEKAPRTDLVLIHSARPYLDDDLWHDVRTAREYIYNTYTKNYYELKQLKVLSHIDASQEHGQNLIDAGVMYFVPENRVNTEMSWHFKHHHIYCVAPVVTNKSIPKTQSYDFWAVGKDCCSIGSPDFRCGQPANPNVRAGIRLFKEEELPFFRLAVQQAETLYNVRATHPIFMYWVEDPLGTIEDAFKRAAALFLRGIGLALLANALLVVLIAFKYSWLGRGQYVFYDF